MKDTHRQVFEWLMKTQDGRLDEDSQISLRPHLEECSQCRQDAALMGLLEQLATGEPLPQPTRPITGQLIANAVQRSRTQQTSAEPLQGAVWGAIVFAVLFLVGLFNDFVRPNVALAAPWLPGPLGQASAAAGAGQAASYAWPFWFTIFLSGIMAPLLVACVGVAMGLRRAYTGWLTCLLAALTLGIGLFIFSTDLSMQGNGIYLLLLIPFLATLLELLAVHLWSNHEQWGWFTWALIAFFFAGVAAFLIFHLTQNLNGSGFSLPSLVTITLLPALPVVTWLAWEWRKPWRWLSSLVWVLVLAGLLLSLIVYSPYILARYAWIRALGPAGSFLWTLVAVTLAGRLVYAIQVKLQPRLHIWATAAALVLLFASLVLDIHAIALQNSVAEDGFLGFYMVLFAISTAMTPVVSYAWRLKGRRLWTGLALMAVFTFGLIPAMLIPNGTARLVTEQRATQINQAVLRFYNQYHKYPTNLAALEPAFLWQVPPPVTANRSDWCYDGDASYYRLGYYENYQYTTPNQIKLKIYAEAGKLPAQSPPCQLELEKSKFLP